MLGFCKLINVVLISRKELVKRRVKEADGHRAAFHGFIYALKVRLLHGQNLCKGGFALFKSVGANHFTECGYAVRFKEHVLGAAKADAFCAKLFCLAGVAGSICVGTNAEAAIFVSPAHNTAEFSGYNRICGGNDAVVNLAGRAVE